MKLSLFLLPCLLLLCCFAQVLDSAKADPVTAPDPLTPTFALMREALHQALQLRFDAAFEIAMRVEQQTQRPLEAQLTRGIIAYFQARWQIHPSLRNPQAGQKALTTLLETGQRQLVRSPRDAQLQLVLGIAAVWQGLLQQQSSAFVDRTLLTQGHTWLQQALMAPQTRLDAHLGLGLLYFAAAGRSPWLPRVTDRDGNDEATTTVYHLRQAVESGHFSGEVARTFLLRVYELEKRYPEAVTLGQALQETFPSNGYYALVSGRSQCAQGHYTWCATILGKLVTDLQTAFVLPMSRDDRFDLYYLWGQALYETDQDALAFDALRQAINQDPGTVKDASLWAKYYLGILYERRGEVKTAEQLYHTLLRGRNVETLHQQIAQRLSQLR